MAFLFRPIFAIGVVVVIRCHAISAKIARVGVTREHKVAFGTDNIFTAVGIATILHVCFVSPYTAQIIIVLYSRTWIAIDTYRVDMIHKAAHTQAFIVGDAITEIVTIVGIFVQRMRVVEQGSTIAVIGGIVAPVGIHIGTSQYSTDLNRWIITVGPWLPIAIHWDTIIGET